VKNVLEGTSGRQDAKQLQKSREEDGDDDDDGYAAADGDDDDDGDNDGMAYRRGELNLLESS
ncbi:Hypothetical predicted protein, partial [Lynx pardinus]